MIVSKILVSERNNTRVGFNKSNLSRAKAFTLVELIVAIVVLGIITALAVPTYNTVTTNFMVNTVNSSLESIKRAGELECAFKTDSSGSAVAAAAVRDMPEGSMLIDAVDNVVSASLTRSGRTVYGSVTFTDCVGSITSGTVVPTPSSEVPSTLDTSSSNTAEITALGSFNDTSTNSSFERSVSKTTVNFSSANWEYITVSFTDSGVPLENSVYKTSGPSVVGVASRLSNTVVSVDLPANQEFTLTIKYNGRSTGTSYIVRAT